MYPLYAPSIMIGAIKLKRLKHIFIGQCFSHFVYYLVCVSVIHFVQRREQGERDKIQEAEMDKLTNEQSLRKARP
eukprot:UN02285